MNNKELATVLAALRYWQDNTPNNDERMCYEHFLPISADVRPLTDVEIDDLCEKLCFGEESS